MGIVRNNGSGHVLKIALTALGILGDREMRVLPLRFRNRLLSAFARDDLEQFFSDLHPESFPPHQTIYSEGGLIEHVYFVEEGLASVLRADPQSC